MPAETSAIPRVPWKYFEPKEAFHLVLPKEHGSWSLAFEPVALGLLTAPSKAGIPLAFAAGAGFFLRRPLRLLLQTRPDPRRPLAAFCAGSLILLAGFGLALAARLGGVAQLWPLIPAAFAGAIFVWFDARNENRAGAVEIAGATSFALLPAAFASLAGWRMESSLALAAVMLARSVPTVMLVRTLLRRAKGRTTTKAPVLLATMIATGILFWLAGLSLAPWMTVAMSFLLLARAIWCLSADRPRLTARQLGYMELILGVVVVLTAAVAWHY